MQSAQNFQGFLNAKKAVNNHFDASKQYHTKTPEHQCVQKANNRPTENFRLPYGNVKHNHKALAKITDREVGFSKFKIADQPANGEGKNSQGDQHGERKNNLLYHNILINSKKDILKAIQEENTLRTS